MANPRVTFDFKADISQINQAIQKIDQRLDRFGGKAKQQTEGFAGGMAKFGLAVSGVQQAFGILDNTIGAVARKVTEMGGGFDHAMNKVKAVTGAGTEEFEALRNSALQFGQTTAKSASEVAKLQFELSKLGFKTDEIQGATEGILNMAIAFDVDLARASEVAGGVLRQFNIDASEAGGVADLMAKAFSSTALDTEKFANAMVYVGQIAPQAGFELHEVTALLGLLSNKMVDSSIAGTALSKIMEQMANSNSDLAKEIGHPIKGMEGFVEVLNKMNEEGTDLSDLLGFVLPRTAKTFGVLVQSAGEIDLLTKSFADLGGEAKEMADIMMQDLVGANLLIDSAMERLWIRISDQLTPSFMSLKEAQIAFIQDIDTEEIYSYTAGLVAMGIAIAYFKRQALQTVLALKAVKVAMATTGWGLAVVALGAVAGAVIDATDAFEDETDAIDKQSRALERARLLTDALKKAKEEITKIKDIQKLAEMRQHQADLNEEIRKSSLIEKQVIADILKNRKHLSTTSIQLTGRTLVTKLLLAKTEEKATLANVEVNIRAYASVEQIYTKSIALSKRRIKSYQADIDREGHIDDENVQRFVKGREERIKKEKENIALQSERAIHLMTIKGMQEEELEQSKLNANAKLIESNKTLDLINLQIDLLQAQVDTEKEATRTSETRLKILEQMEKAERKMRATVLQGAIELETKIALADADKWGRRKIRLAMERKQEKAKIQEHIDNNNEISKILIKRYETDKTLDDTQRTANNKRRTALAKENILMLQQIQKSERFYQGERQKIINEEKEANANLRDEKIGLAQEMGFVIAGEEQRNFDQYIAFLDAKILAEELYSEKWFELMDHRTAKYNAHIAHQVETGRMSDVQHMALLSKQLQDETLTVERKIELQEQLQEVSIGFMESGANIYKSYAKQKLVSFITEQQIRLIGKLAEIMATGASTLGISLAVQLPLYAGAVAILEGAKSKVMAFEKGGLIQQPTMALMGESGPELVIPEQGFKDYVREQIIPFQAQALGVPLSNFTNQNFIQNSVNMTRQEQLTEINTQAIDKMSSEVGLLNKTLNLPQGVTITDGSTIINADMERGRFN